MSYNTTESARELVGQALTAAQLDAAKSIIDQYTPYRWATTSVTRTFSVPESGQEFFFLDHPVLSVDSMTIDDGSGAASKTLGTDFYVDYETGEVYVPGGLPWGYNNVVISYTFGYSSSNGAYKSVLLAEAQIALYLKRNPAKLKRVSLAEGVSIEYGEGIAGYLSGIPKPPYFIPFGNMR